MTKTTKNVLIGLGILAVALLIVVGIGSKGFRNWKFKEWFNYWGKGAPAVTTPEDKPDDVEIPSVYAYLDNGNPVLDGDELPEHMIFHYSTQALSEISPQAANATISLIASITPSDAGVKSVSWRAYFTETTSNNISEYVTVTKNKSNVYQAAVECLKPFDKKIAVECSVTDVYDYTHTAKCDLDYLSVPERITGIIISNGSTQGDLYQNSGAPIDLNMYSSGSNLYTYTVKQINFAWTTGTVREDVSTQVDELNITYFCAEVAGANRSDFGKKADKLEFNSYVMGASGKGTTLLTSCAERNKPIITVTYTLENGREYDVMFKCNFTKGVSSVSMNTPEHTFGE